MVMEGWEGKGCIEGWVIGGLGRRSLGGWWGKRCGMEKEGGGKGGVLCAA